MIEVCSDYGCVCVHISFFVWISDVHNITHAFLFAKWYRIKDGRTPLWIAVEGGHVKVVEYLVTEAKVNPNQPDEVCSVISCVLCLG